jgi:Tol biopolymer transport system component
VAIKKKRKMKKKLIALFLLYSPLMGLSQLENVSSKLEVFDIQNDERATIYEENDHFEAPNWSKDGSYMILNGRGKIFRFDLETKKKTYINTDFADKLNNDHGISPDGKRIVISHYDQPNVDYKDRNFRTSRIYTLPIEGGIPTVVTEKTPSFWHGWSPDGNTLIYTALRNDNFDIYAIHVNGGEEIRLTDDEGLDDGSDFSVHGKYIYYNSMQSGKMEIWRMDANGSNKIQVTDDEFSNWFPHPSPNGESIVYLSYLEDQGSAHPAMKRVALRLVNLDDNSVRTLCHFTGGQGTINVPSWSPDGKKFAFVSYEFIEKPRKSK